jgi:putative adhesin
MSLPVVLAAAAVLSLGSDVDTTFAVKPGANLQVENFAGEVVLSAWDKNAVRIQAPESGGERVIVKPTPRGLSIRTGSKHASSVDLRITVPAWMDLDVSGVQTDVTIDGARGRVRVATIHGDIAVSGGRGQIELNAVDQDIHLADASGVVVSETVNGDLTLQRIESDSVDVSTVNGEIFYEGSLRTRGVYRFTSHNGDIAVAIPMAASATVNVSTFSGEFASDFPVTLQESRPGRRYCFTLGKGGARVDLESFQGTIHVFRPGTRGPVTDVENQRMQRLQERMERIKERFKEQKHEMKHQKRNTNENDDDSEDDSNDDDDGDDGK